jgi:riboflavin kinase/FMN adenylyltransferase
LYGRAIEVALHAYIREERKFDGLDQLAAAMRADEAAARKLLALPE